MYRTVIMVSALMLAGIASQAMAQDVIVMRRVIASPAAKAVAPSNTLKCGTLQQGVPTTSNGEVTTIQQDVPAGTTDLAAYAKAWCEKQIVTGEILSAACTATDFRIYGLGLTTYLRYGPKANSNVLLPPAPAYNDRYAASCTR